MKQGLTMREQRSGPVLVRKPVRRVEAAQVVREATTGRVVMAMPLVAERHKVVLLPRVWAVAEGVNPTHDDETVVSGPTVPTHDDETVGNGPSTAAEGGTAAVEWEQGEREQPVELAFYRKYTEAMLRRYVRLSMAAGRVPSLLGRELFRGNVTHYKVTNFEDVVVFCFDMERLLGKLRSMDQQLIKRIAMQEYTQGETCGLLGISLRTCLQSYGQAIDRLTAMLLEGRMLEPQRCCQ